MYKCPHEDCGVWDYMECFIGVNSGQNIVASGCTAANHHSSILHAATQRESWPSENGNPPSNYHYLPILSLVLLPSACPLLSEICLLLKISRQPVSLTWRGVPSRRPPQAVTKEKSSSN